MFYSYLFNLFIVDDKNTIRNTLTSTNVALNTFLFKKYINNSQDTGSDTCSECLVFT